MDLARLVDLAADRLKVKVQYDAAVLKGTVTLRLGGGVSDAELWELMNRVLVDRGFTTIRTGSAAGAKSDPKDGGANESGTKGDEGGVLSVVKITDAAAAARVRTKEARGEDTAQTGDAASAKVRKETAPGFETVVYRLKHRAAREIVEGVKSVLSKPGGAASALGDGGLLLVSDLTSRLDQVGAVVELLDTPTPEVVIEEVSAVNLPPAALATSATQIAAKRQAAGGEAGKGDAGRSDAGRAALLRGEVVPAPGGASVLIVAPREQVASWKSLLHQLDQREPVESVMYTPRGFGVREVGKLVEQVAKDAAPTTTGATSGAGSSSGASSADDRFRLITDELTGTLIVTATPSQHERVRQLMERLESLPAGSRRPVRSFVVRNRPVTQIVDVLNRLIDAGVLQSRAEENALGPASSTNTRGLTVAPPPTPSPLERNVNSGNAGGRTTDSFPSSSPSSDRSRTGTSPFLPEGPSTGSRGGSSAGSNPSALDRPLTLTADEGTNTLIAVGEPRLLAQVESLLATLDVRQPQVMLEVVLVSLSDSDSLNLGVELERITSSGGSTVRLASLFGLSSASGGTRAVGDAAGFTGSVLNPGEFSLVVRALQSLNTGRSLSQPKVLVNNNEQATINSTLQQPFATTVSTTNTQATTAFGGSLSAGTVLTIRPQIGEGDHLILTYSVSLSAFTGSASSANVPPPRQENSVQSTVTIPDGYTVVVGGLELESEGRSKSQVPLLGDIPLLGEVFKNRNNTDSSTTFYVFIRAAVLRDRSFEDLKYLSDVDVARARIDDGWPEVEARVVR